MSEKKKEMNNKEDKTVEEKKGEDNITKDSSNAIEVIKESSPSSLPKKTVKQKNVPQVLSKDELETLDYADFSTPARMLVLGEVLIKSALVPLKKKEDVVAALLTGKELGLPFITSVTNIYPIEGKPTLGVHIQKALILKSGIIFEKTEDAVAIYNFVQETDKGIEQLGTGTLEEQPKGSKKKQIDTRTTYKFTRAIKKADGTYQDMTAKGSFSIRESVEAGLNDKANWKKYWRRMLDARAFTNGAREIADDILLGIMTPNELSNDFYVNDKGEEVYDATIVETN